MGLIVAVEDGDGKIILKQPYSEYAQGNRDIKITSYTSGRKLFDILVDELGYIRYEENKNAFEFVLKNNIINRSGIGLLGKIAEAIIVRDCREFEEVNIKWFSIARRKRAKRSTASRYIALGTGLLYTKNNYATFYNPSDPQRDIIWVNPETKITSIMPQDRITEATVAGLQIKVSTNGISYVYPEVINKRYEVPLVYFDLNRDFDEIAQRLCKERRDVIIGKDFINARAVDFKEYEELVDYMKLVRGLITGSISPDYLINVQGQNDEILRTAILSSTLKEAKIDNILSRVKYKRKFI